MLNQLARTNLYAYTEAERRKFDFACELLRDWTRPLVGQTLWNHIAGVDKDLRTMLLDPHAEICVYVARDTIKARRLLSEVMHDFRSSGVSIKPHRLRVFWIPQDFDADDETQRNLVYDLLAKDVGRDILMNVVFGNLTPDDIRFFIRSSGVAGLHLAILHEISTTQESHLRIQDLAARFKVSSGSIRERLLRLLGCGFLTQVGGGAAHARATLKGRVFLDLCSELRKQLASGEVKAEMRQILNLLGMRYAPSAVKMSHDALHLAGPLLTEVPEMITGRLIANIDTAIERWGTDLDSIDHVLWEDEWAVGDWGAARQIVEHLRHESSRFLP